MTIKTTSASLMLFFALGMPGTAQWIKILLPDTPRTANGQPDLDDGLGR